MGPARKAKDVKTTNISRNYKQFPQAIMEDL
jgi:hypothetical protein